MTLLFIVFLLIAAPRYLLLLHFCSRNIIQPTLKVWRVIRNTDQFRLSQKQLRMAYSRFTTICGKSTVQPPIVVNDQVVIRFTFIGKIFVYDEKLLTETTGVSH